MVTVKLGIQYDFLFEFAILTSHLYRCIFIGNNFKDNNRNISLNSYIKINVEQLISYIHSEDIIICIIYLYGRTYVYFIILVLLYYTCTLHMFKFLRILL